MEIVLWILRVIQYILGGAVMVGTIGAIIILGIVAISQGTIMSIAGGIGMVVAGLFTIAFIVNLALGNS